MRTFILLTVALAVLGGCGKTIPEERLTAEPWVLLSGHWMPGALEATVPTLISAKVIRFKPDHTFSMLYCILGRNTRENLGIIAGEGLTLFAGRWVNRGSRGLEISYRTVEEAFPAVGSKDPGEVRTRITLGCEADCLLHGSDRFRQLPTFHRQAYDLILDPILEWRRTHATHE